MKVSSRLFAALLPLLVQFSPLWAQTRVSIGFYNVENLYDTVPSLFYDDSDYTPQGRMKWGSERYYNKLVNISRVLDEMSLDITGIAEIESETAVRDLVRTLRTDYNYIHRSSGDFRGMDVALLYKGDKFVPQVIEQIRSGTSREFLYVKGELYGERLDLLVCHLPSQLNSRKVRERAMVSMKKFADSLTIHDPYARLLIMGDFNAAPTDRTMRLLLPGNNRPYAGEQRLFSPFSSPEFYGRGTYVYRGRWLLYDNILMSTRLLGGNMVYRDCGIFIKPYLLESSRYDRRGYPLRTFDRGRYNNGYSDHLPVFAYLEILQ